MIIKKFEIGIYRANNYLLIDEKTNLAVLIDCSGDFEKINYELKKANATLQKIILTHGHFDHIFGLEEALQKSSATVYINEKDFAIAEKLPEQLAVFNLEGGHVPQISNFIKDNEIIEVGNIKIKAVETPGHSEGSMCYFVDNTIFTGDTLFNRGIGRTDLFGGNYQDLVTSLKTKLLNVEQNYKIMPGHGKESYLDFERKNNPFLAEIL